jgi:Tol biopolymer transport system component
VGADTLHRIVAKGDALEPVWTPDSGRVIYTLNESKSHTSVIMRGVSSGGEPEVLVDSTGAMEYWMATSVSPDGKWVVCTHWMEGGKRQGVAAVSLQPPHERRELVSGPDQYRRGMLSPNGKWLLYETWGERRRELDVRANPLMEGAAEAPVVQVAEGEVDACAWSLDGSMIVYLSNDKAMAADFKEEPGPAVSRPRALFDAMQIAPASTFLNPTPDGKHMVFVQMAEEEARVMQLNVVLNWADELRAKVGGGK